MQRTKDTNDRLRQTSSGKFAKEAVHLADIEKEAISNINAGITDGTNKALDAYKQ
jgi:hypothetical protein